MNHLLRELESADNLKEIKKIVFTIFDQNELNEGVEVEVLWYSD